MLNRSSATTLIALVGTLVCLATQHSGGGRIVAVAEAQSTGARPLTQLSAMPFPHPFLYAGLRSNGWPYVGSTAATGTCAGSGAACSYDSDCGGQKCTNPSQLTTLTDPINQATVQAASRFPFMSLPPTPTTDIRPDIYAAVRAANPNNFFMAYTLGSTTWCPFADERHVISYPTGSYYRDYYLAVTSGDPSCDYQGDRMLWYQDGRLPDATAVNVNLAYRIGDATSGYVYPVADAVAQTIFDHVVTPQQFDGLFVDVFCDDIGWMESGTNVFDYKRAGYVDGNGVGNRSAFLSGWKAGHTELAKKLRDLATAAGYPNYPIVGNCNPGPAAVYPYFNGWMREGFPYQNGGDWFSNMYRNPGGMMIEDYRFRTPRQNVIFTGASPYWQPTSSGNLRKMRFGLGTSTLGNAMAAFHESSGGATIAPDFNFWYDEYGVDTITGRADQARTGWLGFPKGPAYEVMNQNNGANLVPPASFDTGIDNWDFAVGSPAVATMTREVGDAPQGAGAVHVAISAVVSGANYAVNFYHANSFAIVANNEYSVTFWAKADHQRTIDVTFDRPAAGGYAFQAQPIDSTWRQYQVRLKPSASHGDSQIWFSLGAETGDVWLDDIHVQAGYTAVYRRDFDHGMVLVNAGEQPETVTLNKPYYKILGSVDPTTNDGSMVSQVTLAGTGSMNGIGDALFLVDIDKTPPSKVNDLQAK